MNEVYCKNCSRRYLNRFGHDLGGCLIPNPGITRDEIGLSEKWNYADMTAENGYMKAKGVVLEKDAAKVRFLLDRMFQISFLNWEKNIIIGSMAHLNRNNDCPFYKKETSGWTLFNVFLLLIVIVVAIGVFIP